MTKELRNMHAMEIGQRRLHSSQLGEGVNTNSNRDYSLSLSATTSAL